jgi:hypothetical protein
LTGGPGDEDQSVIGHATALPFAAPLMHISLCPDTPRLAGFWAVVPPAHCPSSQGARMTPTL